MLLVIYKCEKVCLLWCGVVWCSVVWCVVVWCGVVWRGVAWCVVVWCDVVWCGVWVVLMGVWVCLCMCACVISNSNWDKYIQEEKHQISPSVSYILTILFCAYNPICLAVTEISTSLISEEERLEEM